jgi:hypothetical protein
MYGLLLCAPRVFTASCDINNLQADNVINILPQNSCRLSLRGVF